MKNKHIKKGNIASVSNRLNSNEYIFNWMAIVGVILVGILIYSNSFNCSFHFDDYANFVDNKKIPELHDFKGWWNYSQTRLIGLYSLSLNKYFNHTNVWGYHMVNLLIHLITSCLVWWITWMILSSPIMKDQAFAKNKEIFALFTALLFVSHPLTTQSVTYIVQRLASMVAMFYLLSIALYARGRFIENAGKYLWFTGSFIAALFAFCTKENAFTLPFAIVLVEFFFFRAKTFSLSNIKNLRTILIITSLIGFILLVSLRFSLSVLKPIPINESHLFVMTPWVYLFTQFSVIVKYIQILILPIHQMLEYDFPIATHLFGLGTMLSLLLLIASSILAFYLLNKNRIISFGIFWFFLTLAIESSIIPIDDVIYEHRTYLPSYGFFLILVSGIYLLPTAKFKYLPIAILSIIVIAYSALTYQRNKIWKDDITLWSDNILKAPNKARPYGNRGIAYAKLKLWDKAIADYSKAIELYPNYGTTLYNRGMAYWTLKLYDKAIADYSRAIEVNRKNANAYYNRSAVYAALQQWDKTITDCNSAIALDPDNPEIYFNRGTAYLNSQDWNKAIEDYSSSLKLNPKNPNALCNRGNAYLNSGELEKAISDYSEALRMNPKLYQACYNRGNAFSKLNNWEKAIADYNLALQIDPGLENARIALEIAKLKLNNGKSLR